MDASNSLTKRSQLKALLSKIIHDIYIVKVRQEIGFVVDFKKSTEVIVDYIFMKSGDEESIVYSNNFIRILNRLNEIGRSEITFDNYIEFERDLCFQDKFTERLSNEVLKVINKDFKWNLFFKIMFEIEEGSNADDFEGFLNYLNDRLREGIQDTLDKKEVDNIQRNEINDCILDYIIERFSKDTLIDFINGCNINALNSNIKNLLKDINNYEDWLLIKPEIYNLIMGCSFK